jgi:hypothetical protein
MTKTLNQIIFFFLHQNQNNFFSNIGNQNIFLEKNHNPPFKLNGRSLIEQMVSDKKFLWEFPIGSYVKLSTAVVAILVGGLKCQTQFWKGTTQGSSQQSLVEIGSVVSDEKIF